MQGIDFIFQIAILLMSVVVHEVSHGYVAYMQGDPTAKYEGRLTMNPLKHLDPFGSVLLPALLYLTHGPIIGWAKPVPYNPYNLRNQRWGELYVAIAGPISNLLIAGGFGLLLRYGVASNAFNAPLITALALIVQINILLAIFNLVPIAPLDGSKVLFAFLPYRFEYIRTWMEQYSFFLLLFFIFFLWDYLFPLVTFVFHLITGIGI